MTEQAQRLAAILADYANAKPGPETPRFPPSIAALLPGADADPEPHPGEIEVTVAIGQAMGIEYTDAAGADSRRIISVRRVKPGLDTAMAVSWCYMRAACRTFRVDRIRALIDLHTGVIESERPDIELAFALLLESRINDGYEAARTVIEAAGPAINILTFLSRCDGRMHPEEAQAILNFLDVTAFDLGLPLDAEVAERLVRRMHVTPEMFHRSINRLPRLDPAMVRRIGHAARKVVDADGELSPEEVSCLIELEALF